MPSVKYVPLEESPDKFNSIPHFHYFHLLYSCYKGNKEINQNTRLEEKKLLEKKKLDEEKYDREAIKWKVTLNMERIQ